MNEKPVMLKIENVKKRYMIKKFEEAPKNRKEKIKWLSDWDINPDGTGKNVPTAVKPQRFWRGRLYHWRLKNQILPALDQARAIGKSKSESITNSICPAMHEQSIRSGR